MTSFESSESDWEGLIRLLGVQRNKKSEVNNHTEEGESRRGKQE